MTCSAPTRRRGGGFWEATEYQSKLLASSSSQSSPPVLSPTSSAVGGWSSAFEPCCRHFAPPRKTPNCCSFSINSDSLVVTLTALFVPLYSCVLSHAQTLPHLASPLIMLPTSSSVPEPFVFPQCATLSKLLTAAAPNEIPWYKSQLWILHSNALICTSVCTVTSPVCGREISLPLFTGWWTETLFFLIWSCQIYMKEPQGDRNWVNMSAVFWLHPFIWMQELSQFNLNGYSRLGWFIVSIFDAHVSACIHRMCGKANGAQ